MNVKECEALIASLEAQCLTCDTATKQYDEIQKQITEVKAQAYEHLSAWDIVYLARHPKRPRSDDVIKALFPDFIELHGDRAFGDDAAMRGGLATFHGQPVTVLAQCKGRTLEENMKRNFGMLHPEGYRKAMRLAKQAERFSRPIITLVDTSGAYPGKGAEERGQAEAIASCLSMFSHLRTVVIAIVISEGGSGGALAFTLADHIIMLEHAFYSILSPEGFASILWKDETRAQEAAEVMELKASDLFAKGIVDTIIKEPKEGAHMCFDYICEQLEDVLAKELERLQKKKIKHVLEERYEKFRSMGTAYVR